MDFSEISISTIKNSTEFGSDFTKIFELKNSDQKDSPEKNTELIEFSRSNSILLFIYQTKEVNKNINSNDKVNSMTTRDSSELLSSKKKKNILDFGNSKKNYSKYYPKEIEWKTKPPQKPLSFPIQTYLGLNKEKNEIGTKEFLDLNENIFFSQNGSYKIINQKGHELLNHFLRKDSKTNSICFRYRHKNATFVYYK